VLYEYDISKGMAKSFSPMFIGKTIEAIYHTSIVVYGMEYFFGGAICREYPKSTPYGLPIKEKKLGVTEIPPEIFSDYLKEIESKYCMATYHLIHNNCNHFTNDICQFLVGQELPSYVMKQHEEIIDTPIGKMFLPMIDQMNNSNNAFLPNMIEGKNNQNNTKK